MQRGWVKSLGLVSASAASLWLASCAIIPGPNGSGGALAPVSKSLAIRGSASDEPVARAAEGAVREVLTARGYQISPEARFELVLGLAKRPVEIGFQPNESTGQREKVPYTGALPEDRRLDLCREAIIRLSVVVVNRADNTVAYRGAAEQVRCGEPGSANLKALAYVALDALP